MRDGIYRSLSMPRRWKTLFKVCEREAERDRYALEAAQRAIETDFRQGLGTGFQRRLEAAVDSALQQLPNMRSLPALADLGGQNSSIERDLLANAAGMLSVWEGLDARQFVLEALNRTVQNQRDAQLREAVRHAYANGINGRIAAKALREAMAQIDTRETARRLLEKAPANRGMLRPPIDLEESL